MTTEQLKQLILYMNEATMKKEMRLKTHMFILQSILNNAPIDVEAYFMQKKQHRDIKAFMEQCGVNGKISAINLYKLYEMYCEGQGKQPESNAAFGREVKRLGYPCKRINTGFVYEIGGEWQC